MAGGALVGLAGLSASGTVQAADVVDLGDKGLEDGDTIDSYLDKFFVSGNEVHIPEGTYRWTGTSHSVSDAALIGDGSGVVFQMPNSFTATPDIICTGGTVLVKNITQKGEMRADSNHRNFGFRAASGAELILENFNRPDGQDGPGESTGFYVHKSHAGTVRFRNCHVEGFANNGLYGSSPGVSGGSQGAVIVEGGLYRNNNVDGIRVGSNGSIVRNTTVVQDGPIPPLSSGAIVARGIWVREGGNNITIEENDVTMGPASGVDVGIKLQARDGTGGGTVRSNRIEQNDSVTSIGWFDGSWSGSQNGVTGSNTDTPSNVDSWVSCRGSGCDSPVTGKKWVDSDGNLLSVGDSPSGTPSYTDGDSTVVVSTGDVTGVTETGATLTGTLDGLGGAASVDVAFEYRETGASEWRATDAETRSATGSYSRDVSGLTDGSEYEFRAVASASDGDTDAGDSVSFNTSKQFDHHLVVQTFDGSGLIYEFVTTGDVEPGDDSEIGNNDSITQNSDGSYTVKGSTGNGYTDDWHFDGTVSEWSAERHPDTTSGEYELYLDGTPVSPEELVGNNSDTSVAVSTSDVSNVGKTGATLTGALDDLGGAASVDVSFEYRETGASEWRATDAETRSATGSYSRDVSGLTGDSAYEFRAVASASDGDTDAGSVLGFTTTAVSAAPLVDRLDVTEAGSPNPHADITVDWGVSDPDGDLSQVLVQVADANGVVVDASRTRVSGETASNVDYFRIRNARGESFDVTVFVTDAANEQTTESATVTER